MVNFTIHFVVEAYMVGVPVERVLLAQAQFKPTIGTHGYNADTAIIADTLESYVTLRYSLPL